MHRELIRSVIAVSISLALAACTGGDSDSTDIGNVLWVDSCSEAVGIVLYGGNIHTMDADNSIVSSVRLLNGRIDLAGNEDEEAIGVDGDCKIDLAGHTVIPGLIDNHNHILGRGSKPGHMAFDMDSASSWSEAVDVLRKKIEEDDISLPEEGTVGTQHNFVTAIGAISPGQFAEGGFPSFETLNQIDHPVYIEGALGSGNQTNSAGIAYFRSRGLTVSDDGVVDNSSGQSLFNSPARMSLASEQTPEDRLNQVIAVQGWAASVGITMSMTFDAPDIAQRIFENGDALMRIRAEHGGGSLDQLERDIIDANNAPGNDMFRIYAIGEFLDRVPTSFGATSAEQVVNEATFSPKADLAAELGATVHQHSLQELETDAYLTAFELANDNRDIRALRWQLAHVPLMTTESMDRLHALGGGAVPATFSYSSWEPSPPMPYKALYEHDVHSGIGSDGGNVATINPWLGIYHLTTGLDDAGEVVFSESETLTVNEAIELMTIRNAWFSFDEEALGSIEEGKLADLVVLTDDIFGLEELGSLRDVKSALTILNGRIVYSDNSVVTCTNANTFGEWFPRSGQETCE